MPERSLLMGEARQCGATRKVDGKRCQAYAIIGGTVCACHGGSTPMAKQAAKQRLLAMVEPAFETLMDVMANGDYDQRLRAAKVVLDRAGYGPKATMVLEDERGRQDLSALSAQQLADRAQQLAQQLREQASLPPAPDIIDIMPEDGGVH